MGRPNLFGIVFLNWLIADVVVDVIIIIRIVIVTGTMIG